MTTREMVVIIGTIYLFIGILLSGAIYLIITKSGKDYDDLGFAFTMLFNVIFWPFIFYSIYKEIKNDKEE